MLWTRLQQEGLCWLLGCSVHTAPTLSTPAAGQLAFSSACVFTGIALLISSNDFSCALTAQRTVGARGPGFRAVSSGYAFLAKLHPCSPLTPSPACATLPFTRRFEAVIGLLTGLMSTPPWLRDEGGLRGGRETGERPSAEPWSHTHWLNLSAACGRLIWVQPAAPPNNDASASTITWHRSP